MRWALILVAASLLAGCSARGDDDPFAYTRKPLYAGSFDLAALGEDHTVAQRFWVTDGSINNVRLLVWVNATQGTGAVSVYDPSGNLAISSSDEDGRTLPLRLGDWRVVVTGSSDAVGRVDVLALR